MGDLILPTWCPDRLRAEAVITGPDTATAGETVTFSGDDSIVASISLFEWDQRRGQHVLPGAQPQRAHRQPHDAGVGFPSAEIVKRGSPTAGTDGPRQP
jgi:hypothetical protein